jgi:hypothetical protein
LEYYIVFVANVERSMDKKRMIGGAIAVLGAVGMVGAVSLVILDGSEKTYAEQASPIGLAYYSRDGFGLRQYLPYRVLITDGSVRRFNYLEARLQRTLEEVRSVCGLEGDLSPIDQAMTQLPIRTSQENCVDLLVSRLSQ